MRIVRNVLSQTPMPREPVPAPQPLGESDALVSRLLGLRQPPKLSGRYVVRTADLPDLRVAPRPPEPPRKLLVLA